MGRNGVVKRKGKNTSYQRIGLGRSSPPSMLAGVRWSRAVRGSSRPAGVPVVNCARSGRGVRLDGDRDGRREGQVRLGSGDKVDSVRARRLSSAPRGRGKGPSGTIARERVRFDGGSPAVCPLLGVPRPRGVKGDDEAAPLRGRDIQVDRMPDEKRAVCALGTACPFRPHPLRGPDGEGGVLLFILLLRNKRLHLEGDRRRARRIEPRRMLLEAYSYRVGRSPGARRNSERAYLALTISQDPGPWTEGWDSKRASSSHVVTDDGEELPEPLPEGGRHQLTCSVEIDVSGAADDVAMFEEGEGVTIIFDSSCERDARVGNRQATSGSTDVSFCNRTTASSGSFASYTITA